VSERTALVFSTQGSASLQYLFSLNGVVAEIADWRNAGSLIIPMMFGFGRAGSPSRPVYGLHPHSPRAARRSAPTNNLPVIYVSPNLNTRRF